MTRFTRARQPEEKEERRQTLLRTARRLLERGVARGRALETLGLNELARRARMTKSNVYRYFDSREHVLLELLRDEWLAWYADFTTTFPSTSASAPSSERVSRAALAAHLARTLVARPLLCELTSALPSVLEQNVSDDAILEFKRLSLAFFDEAGAFLALRVDGFTNEVAFHFLHDAVVVLAGLWPFARPAPAVARVLDEHPELHVMRRAFEPDLARMLLALVDGAVSRGAR